MQEIVTIKDGQPRLPQYQFRAPINLTLREGECVALCGPNGGGKTLLAQVLTGAVPLCHDAATFRFPTTLERRLSSFIRTITFRDVYGTAEPAYYQQRWNHGDEMQFPTVREMLQQAGAKERIATAGTPILYKDLGIDALLDRQVNYLSSGELRRFQLARTLLSHPAMLLIDNPYIGLDEEARATLTNLLDDLRKKLTLILVVNRVQDIPSFVDAVVHVEDRIVSQPVSREKYIAQHSQDAEECPLSQETENYSQKAKEYSQETEKCPQSQETEKYSQETQECSQESEKCSQEQATSPSPAQQDAPTIVDFRNITVAYGQRRVLDDLCWTVHQGEHWALTGRNGSGKTTLLSLVCADNPIAYACNISLFGRRRGTGESIWDIKRRIGYVSPEIYSTYRKSLPAVSILASGLRDTIGIYRTPSDAEIAVCRTWLDRFGIQHLADRNYLQLSSGEQRLVLLARAFVKSPDLLILDEPFHGLDDTHIHRARRIIDRYMQSDPTRTLIMVSHYEREFPTCIDHRLVLTKN